MFHAKTTLTGHMVTENIAHLPQLELTPIRMKVANEHSELTAEQLEDLELRYLKFLMLCKTEPNVRHELEKDVDQYWHAHILHTKQYTSDCQRYFGYYLHHEPNANGQGCDDGCGIIPA